MVKSSCGLQIEQQVLEQRWCFHHLSLTAVPVFSPSSLEELILAILVALPMLLPVAPEHCDFLWPYFLARWHRPGPHTGVLSIGSKSPALG